MNNTIGLCEHMLPAQGSPEYHQMRREQASASALKYDTRSAWKTGDRSSYAYALTNGLLDELCSHMAPIQGSDAYRADRLEQARQSALKYRTRGEWKAADRSGYEFARKNGFLNELTLHQAGAVGRKK